MIILQRIDRFLARVYLIAGIIAAVSIVLIGLSVVASVGSRILGVYISGVTELAGYAMAWAAFFGMAYTFRVGGHIRIRLFISRLSGKWQVVAELWGYLALATIACFMAWYLSTALVLDSYHFGSISEGSDAWPLWIPQLPVAIGASLFALATVHTLVAYIGHLVFASPNAEPEPEQELEQVTRPTDP